MLLCGIYMLYILDILSKGSKHRNVLLIVLLIERDMAQWLERGALPMSLPAVRFRIPLGAEFSEKYNVSPLSILGHC